MKVAALALTLMMALAAAGPAGAGHAADDRLRLGRGAVAVEGGDAARILPPAGVEVAPYANAGYRLRLIAGEARIEIDTAPLESRSPFAASAIRPDAADDPVARLAWALTAGAETEYQAVSRILGWMAGNLRYDLDRAQPQDAAAVLARRSGYCTGIARLAVALLESVAIPAREVAGWVADGADGAAAGADDRTARSVPGTAGVPAGFHRWIEVRLADVGWVFSDPLTSHHYVPASYVRLASEALRPDAGTAGLIVARDDRRDVVDLYPDAVAGVTARRNSGRQLAAALRVRVEDRRSGTAVLEGRDRRRIHALADGTATFVGLDPGHYTLRLLLPGQPVVERSIELADRVRTALFLSGPPPARTPPDAAEKSDNEEGPR